MRGSISLDFIIAAFVIMSFASIVLSFAYFQEEKIVEASLKARLEEMAISTGSAINRFVATEPEDGSKLEITPHNVTGAPFYGILFDVLSCNYSIDSGNVTFNLTYVSRPLGNERTLTAKYPVFISSSSSQRNCGESLNLTVSSGGISIE